MKISRFLMAIFLSVLCAISSSAQKKFKYELNNEKNRLYTVSPNFKQPIDEVNQDDRLRGAGVYFDDSEKIGLEIDSVIKNAVTAEKWQDLFGLAQENKRADISLTFSPSGDFYRLIFYLKPSHLEILSDDDLYSIYQAFLNFRMDMSLVDLEYPFGNTKSPDDFFWSVGTPFPSKAYRALMENQKP